MRSGDALQEWAEVQAGQLASEGQCEHNALGPCQILRFCVALSSLGDRCPKRVSLWFMFHPPKKNSKEQGSLAKLHFKDLHISPTFFMTLTLPGLVYGASTAGICSCSAAQDPLSMRISPLAERANEVKQSSKPSRKSLAVEHEAGKGWSGCWGFGIVFRFFFFNIRYP